MITLDNELEFENLLSFRSKVTQQELQEEMKSIELFMKTNSLKKVGPTITTTYAIQQAMIPTMDIEVLIPIEGQPVSNNRYIFKDKFRLVNALKISHKGNPVLLQQTVSEVQKFIQDKKLQPITSLYNVTIKEAKTPEEINNVQIDMYIGVNPNII
ncbi:transcriptional regulator [Clostridium sp. UBA1652]|uniref:transcriptional regulator n=1 Tax=Clostridium sp. UBA1652 TaxID=1946348 RepID=UPI00257B032F|nr:transcriptional regulator [Clostridium sp. UBA1652]